MLIRDIVASRDEFFVALLIGTVAGTTGNIFAATISGFILLLLLKLKVEKGAAC